MTLCNRVSSAAATSSRSCGAALPTQSIWPEESIPAHSPYRANGPLGEGQPGLQPRHPTARALRPPVPSDRLCRPERPVHAGTAAYALRHSPRALSEGICWEVKTKRLWEKRGVRTSKKTPITFPPDFSFAVFQLVMRKLSQNTLFAQFARIFT